MSLASDMAYAISLFTQQRPTTAPAEISPEEKQVVVSAFHDADLDHKGFLSREDLKVAIVILFGYKPSKYEVDLLMSQSMDSVGEETKCQGVPLNKFIQLMTSKMALKDDNEEIRQIFLAFDSQCRGFLTVGDLLRVFSCVAPHLPGHTVESAFREIDRDGDGRVSYKDFEFMMKYSLEDGV